ncbi:flagellin [uncultured Tyzzerella sp.]|uniref:flagellin N-terminal helical domain-containing protein n=1 Tax=uncultured Tyzzerella sp. TaxID=2321398 RepID=UPI002942310A|nr:flagellin [uncultured Tyzzerella sp.]
MILNTNPQALLANNALWHRNNSLVKASTNLSTGIKINKTGDDPTGMAVSNKMRLQIKGIEMADRNVNDAISLIQTAEGSIGEMQNITQRMRELAVQASNGTLTPEDRNLIQKEIVQLSEELNAISERTEFNKKHLINGDYEEFIFHTGNDYRDNLKVSFKPINAPVLGLSTKKEKEYDDNGNQLQTEIDGLNYTTIDGAQEAITRCDEALKRISNYRANLGANQNRLEKTSNSLIISEESTRSALSRVLDTDMAGEMAEYTKNNVLVQAGISMLSQSNQRPNQLLSLLQ